MTEVTRPNKRPVAPSLDTLPVASREDVVAQDTIREEWVALQRRDGAWVKAKIVGRELSWETQNEITDRHTRVHQVGRQTRRVVDSTAVMRDLLRAMLAPEQCEPVLSVDDLSKFRENSLKAVLKVFDMDPDTLQEVEDAAGE